ncbi:DNA-directed RNA polymerase subunit H [Candidatus Woesearchaeota archaeon]|jgi:DNA-directed RNA polymerase subunit H|nr:DNA-directed RNA polymerase subunit H [Candidatus Woesearchaeota archaeon]MBT4110730.1 DNA-directed RNA polymerase subunit H [Candidatus Woesearchaeota archaeon]MBT4336326.1 DNA-directed RNA polymerase subunit H [Candidatus Woesearchaeota archaeon]MBT4469313.1 DNA-directed RNA polymerase subunit H [Candidatus Woesearchaeota archaeon]MBT6743864.1 DNA-directed RNA polymerase subunit H [Candidatus Woesearchaeota archaeon]
MTLDGNKHLLIPKHSKLNESDKKKLLEEYKINVFSLPKITSEDPAIVKFNAKVGDVIKIERDSKTAGTTSYYRVVVES